MAKKTVLRRLFKYLPVSIEYVEAQDREDRDSLMADIDLPAESVVDVSAYEPAEQPEIIDAEPTHQEPVTA